MSSMTRAIRFSVVFGLWAVLLSCSSGERDRPPPTTGRPPVTNPGTPCGNKEVNGSEVCDGTAFRVSNACADHQLGEGMLGCTAGCLLDLSSCGFSDYCTANGLYGNGQCDPCDKLGGVRDPDCMIVCGADGSCAERFEPLVGAFVCRGVGLVDPDCGLCGNAIVEPGEVCDGQTFPQGQHRCEDWGYVSGNIACRGDCAPEFAGCRAASCGDGNIEGQETCDGTNLAGATCTGLGFVGGDVRCGTDCRVDTSSCIAPGCGNGIVEPETEVCDGAQLGTETCASLGFAGGTLACTGACTHDSSACVSPGCGNGIIEAVEQCEGANLNGQSCMTQGFLQGTLGCSTTSCTFDTSMCIAPGCGNGIIEPNTEQCEGTNLNNQTCQSRGFAGGTLTCNASCQFDQTQCVNTGCGNNIIESGEQCDGMMLAGQSCFTRGFDVGALRCNQCQFDTSQCRNTCGDGVVNALEICDGTSFRNNASTACSGVSLGTGNLTCRNDCTISFAGCAMTDFCAANFWYNDDVCDPCHLLGGMIDPDCTAGCGANGMCATYFSDFIGGDTCVAAMGAGTRDPDCTCGNGTLQQGEFCDGTQFADAATAVCTRYGFTTGTVRCTALCEPDVSLCQ